jgi:hypothetical protein
VIVRTGFYVKIEVRGLLILVALNRTSQSIKCRIISQLSNCLTPINWSKLCHKDISLVIVILVVATLKFRDILTYSPVLLILCVIHRPTSRFAIYKALLALITVSSTVSSVSKE